MYYIYMLRCKDNSIYTGITTDIARRMKEHFNKEKRCAKYTLTHSAKKLEALWVAENKSLASKLEFNIKKLKKQLQLFLCTIIFLDLVEDVFEKEIMKLDIITDNFISTYLISDFVTPIAKIITNLGGAISLISITIILLVVLKNKKIGIAVMINLLISTVLNIILKNVVQRPRPNEFRLITETGYSFPSGHSMVSMAFYGLLIYLIYKLVKNSKIKWTLIISLSIIICTIGISRIYLGVHYASDVLAGFTISISYLVIYTSIIKRFIGESRKNEENEKDKKQL